MYSKPMHINFPQDIAEGLTSLSAEMGRPRTKLIFEACRLYLNNNEAITNHHPQVNQPDTWTPLDFLSSSGTGIR